MRCHLIIINNKNIYVNAYVIWIYDSFVSQFSSFQNRMSTRIVLRSSESQKLFPDNKPYSFTVELPKWLNFSEMSSWILQLTEFHANGVGKNTQKELFVFCNVCGTSVVGEQYRPLLRRIFLEGDKNIIFLRPYEVPIKDNGVRSLNFEIKDKDFQPAFFLTDEVSMTIEFKQKWAFCPCWLPWWCTPFQNVIFDDQVDNDTICVEVMSHLFREKGHTTGHPDKKWKQNKKMQPRTARRRSDGPKEIELLKLWNVQNVLFIFL